MNKVRLLMDKKAMTLLETVLALTIGGLVLLTISKLVAVSSRNFRDNVESNVMQQHARVAMDRIIWELRYANVLNSVGATLSFGTTNVWDTDAGTETIVYDGPTQAIRRSVYDDDSSLVSGWLEIAGIIGSNTIDRIILTSFNTTGLKVDGSNNLVPLAGGDPLTLAVAVRVDFTLQDNDGQTFSLSSVGKMRNL